MTESNAQQPMTSASNSNPAAVLVLGDTTVAVMTVAELVKRGETVVWAKGTGSRVLPVMPFLKSDLAWGGLLSAASLDGAQLIDEAGIPTVEMGCFHRVHKTKAFKLPDYRRHALSESVWAPEQQCLAEQEYRVRGLTPRQIEEALRAELETHGLVQHVPAVPVIEMEIYDHGGEVQFANQVRAQFKQCFYCDSAPALKMLPKLATVLKHQTGRSGIKSQDQLSVLQVTFTHSQEMPYPTDTGFMIPMNRDAGEEFDRDVLGHFVDSKHSVWTVFLKLDECEDNHEIMKKLRKLKQSLNRAWSSEAENAVEFMKTVEKEQVRFELGFTVLNHDLQESASNRDFVMLSESFGLSRALEQFANYFQIAPVETGDSVEFLDRLSEIQTRPADASASSM